MILLTNNFNLQNANRFLQSFTETIPSIYYMFAGRPQTFSNDLAPPTIDDNTNDVLIETYQNMIYAKHISSNDVVNLVTRNDWVSNTIYQKYTDTTANLFSKNFFVVVNEGSNYSVFKCLDNNNGAPSTDAPLSTETSADDDFYFTSDGYQWKYMYSITPSQYDKFTTAKFIPVYVNANVSGNAIFGTIDTIEVVSGGDRYNSYANGTIQETAVGGNNLIFTIESTSAANSNFYTGSAFKIVSGPGSGQQKTIVGYTVAGTTKRVIIDSQFSIAPTTSSQYEISPLVTIVGDGTGAKARAIVNTSSNSISKIEISARGNGYTYAVATVTANTGLINVATNTAIIANTANLHVIIGPKGGHGSNAAAELGSHFVGVSVTFDSTLAGGKIVDENDFRVFGIIRNPLFANVQITLNNLSGSFTVGERVTQSNTNANGVVTLANTTIVRLTNAYGFFLTGNSTVNKITGQTSNATSEVAGVSTPTTYIDQTQRFIATLETANNFIEDEVVFQPSNENANGIYYNSNSTVLSIVNSKGTFNQSDISSNAYIEGVTSSARSLISGILQPDFVKSSGDVLYIENFSPVTKATNQTETVKLILEF